MVDSSCPGGTLYTIRAGDTLFALSRQFGVPINSLLAANPGINPDNLQIGQIICIPAPETGCPGFIYRVISGDTLYAISRRFHTTVQAIEFVNRGIDPNNLQVGQPICIPVGACPAGTFPYIIKAGDTYYAIARRYSIGIQDLIDANPGVDPNNLFIGQTICVPVSP